MKRLALIGAVSIGLSGCLATTTKMQINEDVTYKNWNDYEAIDTVSFNRKSRGGDLNVCLLQSVSNRSVTLTDSSGSFVGPYTGNYYINTNTRDVDGSDVIVHSSEGVMVANGSTQFQANTFVKQIVRYTLTVTPSKYKFSNIEQAQADTGGVANEGFKPVGAWGTARPDKTVNALKEISSRLDTCLGS